MQRYKIVFGGAMGSGKSQAISSLSEIPVFATEAMNTDLGSHNKLLTTVGIDYGEITISDGLKIGLYGTPGQNRFNFMWPLIAKGALGAVILIDHSSSDPLVDLDAYVRAFSLEAHRTVVIGVTHIDQSELKSLSRYREWMAQRSICFPVFAVDARRREDVLLLIETIIASLEVQDSHGVEVLG